MRFVLGSRMHLEFLPGRKAPRRRDVKGKKEPVTTGLGTEGSRQREPATESLEVGGSSPRARDGRRPGEEEKVCRRSWASWWGQERGGGGRQIREEILESKRKKTEPWTRTAATEKVRRGVV